MTPFDPGLLLAVLTAFSPVVSIAALAQARADRPSAFANGTIVGAGDRLRLADGRTFLLIYQGAWCVVGDTPDAAAAGPWDANRIAAFFVGQGVAVAPSVIAQWLGYWQKWGWKDPAYFLFRLSHAEELVAAGKATPLPADPGNPAFALEDGPLTPIDGAALLFPRRDPTALEALVTGHLATLDGTDAQLDGVTAAVAAFDPAASAAALDDGALEDAATHHASAQDALDGQSPVDLVATSDGHLALIDTIRPDYNEPPPPDATVPDPGEPPPKDGNGGDGGPPKA